VVEGTYFIEQLNQDAPTTMGRAIKCPLA